MDIVTFLFWAGGGALLIGVLGIGLMAWLVNNDDIWDDDDDVL